MAAEMTMELAPPPLARTATASDYEPSDEHDRESGARGGIGSASTGFGADAVGGGLVAVVGEGVGGEAVGG